jgi:uncharacterized protein (DUF1778 family)
MKRNHHQVAKQNSRPSAAPQLKKARSRAAVRPTSLSPSIVLFQDHDGGVSEEGIDLSVAEYAALKHAAAPTGDGILMFMANAALEKVTQSGEVSLKRAAKQPSCLCFYPAGVGELIGEIPLVQHELSEVVIAAYHQGITVDQFIADAIKEKLCASRGEQAADQMTAPLPVKFRIRAQSPERTVEVRLDGEQTESIDRAAQSAGLRLEELFQFIFIRQLGAFDPKGGGYTICDARSEVSDALEKGERSSGAIESIARAILEKLKDTKDPSPVYAQVCAWTSLISDLATRVRVSMNDAHFHWHSGIVPVLLERQSAPGSQAAA